MSLIEGVCNSPEDKAQDSCFSCQYAIIVSFEREGIGSRVRWSRWAQGRKVCLCLLQGSNFHWAQWEASACKLHWKLMCIKGFTVVDCSKTQCCGASMALVSEKYMFRFQSIPCWKGEKSQDVFGRVVISPAGHFHVRITHFSNKNHHESFAVLINSTSTYSTFWK